MLTARIVQLEAEKTSITLISNTNSGVYVTATCPAQTNAIGCTVGKAMGSASVVSNACTCYSGGNNSRFQPVIHIIVIVVVVVSFLFEKLIEIVYNSQGSMYDFMSENSNIMNLIVLCFVLLLYDQKTFF
jgi:hypothetical protein